MELSTGMAKSQRPFQYYLRYSAVGIELGLSVLVGLFIGKYLDDRLGTKPWLLLLFLILGVVAGFRAIIRATRRMMEEERQRETDT
jgi:ATP synthase protein I